MLLYYVRGSLYAQAGRPISLYCPRVGTSSVAFLKTNGHSGTPKSIYFYIRFYVEATRRAAVFVWYANRYRITRLFQLYMLKAAEGRTKSTAISILASLSGEKVLR